MSERGLRIRQIAIAIISACIFPAAYLAAQVLVTIVAVVALTVENIMSGGAGDMDMIYNTILQSATEHVMQITLAACLLVVAAVVITLRVKKRSVTAALRLAPPRGTRKRLVWQLPLALLLGIVLNCATAFILAMIPIPESILNEYNEIMDAVVYGSGFLMSFLVMGVVAPVTEEVVFRGWTMNRLRRTLPFWAALTLQSVIFAVVHGNPLQIAYVLPVAFAFGMVYYWSDSMYVACLMHVGYNLLSVITSYMPAGEAEQLEQQVTHIGVYAVLTAGCAVVITVIMIAFRCSYRNTKGLVPTEQ